MRIAKMLAGIICVVGLSSGCYHATVTTGAPASTEVISKTFASSWIFGLVPPSTVEAASECPNGVAQVETQLSFVNQLIGFLTLGIYTPMNIEVTCAASSSSSAASLTPDLEVSSAEGSAEIRETFGKAAESAAATRAPVLVQVR